MGFYKSENMFPISIYQLDANVQMSYYQYYNQYS
jgi:hypothetical protein